MGNVCPPAPRAGRAFRRTGSHDDKRNENPVSVETPPPVSACRCMQYYLGLPPRKTVH
jgi:hypothetical protein